MKKQSGITLIALVITIVVLLILAGVSISMVIGSNGILTNGQNAVEKHAIAEEQESEDLDTLANYMEQYSSGTIVNPAPEETPEEEEEEIPAVTTEEPNITVTTSVEDMTIKAAVTLNNSANVSSPVTYSYYIKKSTEADTEYVQKHESENLTYDFVTTEATTYNIKVVATSSDSKTGSDTEEATTVTVCFVAGTKVLTETGFKNIEDIVIGEKVYSLNTDNNQKELREVTNTLISTSNEIYKITVGDKLVEATPKHRFYIVDKGWIRAKDLEIGDKIVAKDDSSMEIKSIELEKYEEPIKVYNLTVEGTHTYLITDLELLVHNASREEEIPPM